MRLSVSCMSCVLLALPIYFPQALAVRRYSAWVETSTEAPTTVHTNAPVLRWSSQVDSGGTFAYKVDVWSEPEHKLIWSTGNVWQGNWPSHAPAFPGLCVYEGPELTAGHKYSFTVHEQQAANSTGHNVSRSWDGGTGNFITSAKLPGAKQELISELEKPNMTKLWNTSSNSIVSRVEPSGFLPTSVSGGYGGITSEFVRDGAGMIIGMLELGPEHWPTARRAMRFMLHGLQCTQNAQIKPGCHVAKNMTRNPPEVITGDCPETARQKGQCKYNTKIIDVNANEETDGGFYVISAWGRVVAVTGDTELENDYFATLKTYLDFYFPADDRGNGSMSSTGTAYWNESMGLLWTPNLEHSRLTKMWSAYDTLTNSFAVDGLRYMIAAAKRRVASGQVTHKDIERWARYRATIVQRGLDESLNYHGIETGGKSIYAEFYGHVNGYGADSNRQRWDLGDPAPLVPGMSWVQLAVVNNLLSNLSSAGGPAPLVPVQDLGVLPARVDNTFDTYARSGSFLWLNEDIELSALVQTTNVNSTQLRAPPYHVGPGPPPPSPFPNSSCAKPLRGKSALLVATGPDGWKGVLQDFGQCCAKCETVGLSSCEGWFYRADTKECFLKPRASADSVTKPMDVFYGGLNSQASPPHRENTDAWCYTVSWPFGGSCKPGCPCPARVVIGKGLGWEIGWQAHRERWTRLIAITRWLGAAHHVEKQPLYGEDMDYDCLKALEEGKTVAPSNGRCWGDAGNGVQIGWFVWGEAFMRRKLGLL